MNIYIQRDDHILTPKVQIKFREIIRTDDTKFAFVLSLVLDFSKSVDNFNPKWRTAFWFCD